MKNTKIDIDKLTSYEQAVLENEIWLKRAAQIKMALMSACLLSIILIGLIIWHSEYGLTVKIERQSETINKLTEDLDKTTKLAENRRLVLAIKEAQLDGARVYVEHQTNTSLKEAFDEMSQKYITTYNVQEGKSSENVKADICNLMAKPTPNLPCYIKTK